MGKLMKLTKMAKKYTQLSKSYSSKISAKMSICLILATDLLSIMITLMFSDFFSDDRKYSFLPYLWNNIYVNTICVLAFALNAYMFTGLPSSIFLCCVIFMCIHIQDVIESIKTLDSSPKIYLKENLRKCIMDYQFIKV